MGLRHLFISISIQENLLCKKKKKRSRTFLSDFFSVRYSGSIYAPEISGSLASRTEKGGQESQRRKKGMCQRGLKTPNVDSK